VPGPVPSPSKVLTLDDAVASASDVVRVRVLVEAPQHSGLLGPLDYRHDVALPPGTRHPSAPTRAMALPPGLWPTSSP
jgi:hypothetical protein